MKAVPLELKEANAFVEQLHRHHAPGLGITSQSIAQRKNKDGARYYRQKGRTYEPTYYR